MTDFCQTYLALDSTDRVDEVKSATNTGPYIDIMNQLIPSLINLLAIHAKLDKYGA